MAKCPYGLVVDWLWIGHELADWWICQGLALYRQIDPGLAMDGRFGNVLTHRIRIGIGLVN